MSKQKRMAGALWLMVCLLAVSQLAWGESLQAQRDRYAQIKLAWDKRQMDKVAQLMPGLRDYPLYPYLQYRKLTSQLTAASLAQVNEFVQAYPDMPVSRTLTSRFVSELARRKEWKTLLAFSPQPPSGTSAQCQYYLAKWHTGETQTAWQGAKELWLSHHESQAGCQPLFAAWRAAGYPHEADYQQRLLQAIQQGDWRQVSEEIRQMHQPPDKLNTALLALAKKPDALTDFARSAPVSPFSREVLISVFHRQARKNADQLRQSLPALKQAQKLDAAQYQQLREILAWQYMGKSTSAPQARWRDEVIAHSQSTALTERRIRLALAMHDDAALTQWLARLAPAAQQKEEWRYWQAMMLEKQGEPQQAKDILQALTHIRGFYPMLAAQRLSIPYPLKVDKAPAPQETALLHHKTLARVRELKYWQQESTARAEWQNLLKRVPREQQAALARYAHGQHWWDLSVQATIAGKLWDHLKLRFPLAYQPLFHQYLANKTIPLSYAMAIARQESAWNPQIHSPAGAIGLMQLMPATARQTAKKFHITDYRHVNQLEDPATNIEIGTQYLQYVYQLFANNRILAAAAYNAGPGRVRSWLAGSAGHLDAVAFIESIPFTETRGYVKNVLAYDVYYRHFLGDQHQQLLTDAEWQQQY